MAGPKQIAAYFDVITNMAEFEIMSEILSGIHRYVRAAGTITLGQNPIRSFLIRPQDLPAWSGDGIIGIFYDAPVVKSLLDRGIAVLNLTEHLSPLAVPVVVSDNMQIGRLAAAHLMERGYRRFGYIGFDRIFSNQRRDGFLAGLAERDIGADKIWTANLLDGPGLSPEWFAKIYGKPEFPVGLLVADDTLAVRTLIAAQANGLRIPQDLAIIGVNDQDLICSSVAIPLTSVAPAYGKIGFEAARLLDQLLQGKPVNKTVIRVPPMGLVPRMSTRYFAFDDPLVELALTYMHANISQPYKVADVVNHCGKSRRTLEIRFGKAVGRSLHEEINRLRLDRAKQLLTDTDWTVDRVAQACGFVASPRLYEAFVRSEGITPNAFRAS
jgi:LacI family transcriptional regulator